MPPRELKTFWLGLTLTIALRKQYKDVVCLIPVNKLDTALVQIMFDRVMAAFDDIFLVLAVSTDNHARNRLVIVFFCMIQAFLYLWLFLHICKCCFTSTCSMILLSTPPACGHPW